jgi:hypothetical protein
MKLSSKSEPYSCLHLLRQFLSMYTVTTVLPNVCTDVCINPGILAAECVSRALELLPGTCSSS